MSAASHVGVRALTALCTLISSTAMLHCAARPPACFIGNAEGHSYCFFTNRAFDSPGRVIEAGACPRTYDGARITVPKGTVCLAEKTSVVPPEVCASLPDGCAGPDDRTRATPTDVRRAELVERAGMRYSRCATKNTGTGDIVLEPIHDRLDDDSVRREPPDLKARYAALPSIWESGVSGCCAPTSGGASCLHLSASASTPEERDAILKKIAEVSPGRGSGRPAIEVDFRIPPP